MSRNHQTLKKAKRNSEHDAIVLEVLLTLCKTVSPISTQDFPLRIIAEKAGLEDYTAYNALLRLSESGEVIRRPSDGVRGRSWRYTINKEQ